VKLTDAERAEFVRRLCALHGGVVVRRCDTPQQGGIYLPDTEAARGFFFELIRVASDCRVFRPGWAADQGRYGATVVCPESALLLEPVFADPGAHGAGYSRSDCPYLIGHESALLPLLVRDRGLVPLADAVVLEIEIVEQAGGIVMAPIDAEWEIRVARVTAVGPKAHDVAVGDEAILAKGPLWRFRCAGKRYGYVRERDIVGVRR